MSRSVSKLIGLLAIAAGFVCVAVWWTIEQRAEIQRNAGIEAFRDRVESAPAIVEPPPTVELTGSVPQQRLGEGAQDDVPGAGGSDGDIAPRSTNEPSPPSLASAWQQSAQSPDTSDWSPGRIEAWRQVTSASPFDPIALLDIPSLDLEVPVYPGADEAQLDLGVGHIRGTTPIGANGNIGLSSHRDGFFRKLRNIEIGDRVRLQDLDGIFHEYEVHEMSIVEPEDVHVLYPQGDDRVTLVTCYPFYFVGHAPQRFIVGARRVSSPGDANSSG